ncbi:MAG: carboxypeptidase-like regulatory domain-containing protein [Flavobacteriaceae bacterium]|nr:carboxypeptidase-like regulatory domain-containing protein [Flavobacteriaceae bacterium]
MNRLYLMFFFLFVIKIQAQDNRHPIHGFVTNDSLPIENVHIINKTTSKGTISNYNGKFNISVKENDTLIFSSIQYKTKWIIVNNQQLKNKSLKIILFQKTNNLPEVIVKNMAKSLGLPNADKTPLNKLERNLNAYSQKSAPLVFLDALLLGPILNNIPFVKQRKGGIDDIYNIISGNRKRDQKLKKLIDEDQELETNQKYIQNIRNHFQDDFFINTLHIPKEKINLFIDYCLPKNIIYLFNKKRHVEVVNIFIKESEDFKPTN